MAYDFSLEDSLYKRLKPKLIAEGKRGQVIVIKCFGVSIKESDVVGIFPTFEEAYAAGLDKHGQVPMLVREIGSEECPRCGVEYTNVGHPLTPGKIMMRVCACLAIQSEGGGTRPRSSRVAARYRLRLAHGSRC